MAVKVLDFGHAKTMAPSSRGPGVKIADSTSIRISVSNRSGSPESRQGEEPWFRGSFSMLVFGE